MVLVPLWWDLGNPLACSALLFWPAAPCQLAIFVFVFLSSSSSLSLSPSPSPFPSPSLSFYYDTRSCSLGKPSQKETPFHLGIVQITPARDLANFFETGESR